MKREILRRLERLEGGLLTIIQLNHLFSERADRLEKRIEILEGQEPGGEKQS